MKNTVTVAPVGVASDHIAGRVTEVLEREVRLGPDEFSVTEVSLLHVPIVTVELATAGKAYRKIVQAATGRTIWDDTLKCTFCEHPSKAVCEVCGGTVCQEHMRRCGSCGKHVCSNHVAKGPHKTLLCPECKKQ